MCLCVFDFREYLQGLDKDRKGAEAKKGKKKDSSSDEEPDPDAMDWWTKYHASMDTMFRVCLDLSCLSVLCYYIISFVKLRDKLVLFFIYVKDSCQLLGVEADLTDYYYLVA